MKNQEKPESSEGIFPKDQENNEINNELNEIINLKKMLAKIIWYMKQINTHIILSKLKR